MKSTISLLFLLFTVTFAKAQRPEADHIKVNNGELAIQPITHATLVLMYNGKNIYVDPTGGDSAFMGLASPNIIIVTDIHGDHFDIKTIEAVNKSNAVLV